MKKISLLILSIILAGSFVFASSSIQNVSVIVLPGVLEVYSPVQDSLYLARQIPINVSMLGEAKYFKYNTEKDNKLITLCRNCNEYGFFKKRTKPFDDGFHEMVIFAIFDNGNISKEVNFTVETKNPKIKKTEPKSGFYTGSFYIEFEEANPVSLLLNYGNENTGFREENVNLEDCWLIKGGKKACNVDVAMEDYDNEEISYYFRLDDIANNSAVSKDKKLKIDTTFPNIKSFNHTIEGKKVSFSLEIEEINFDLAEYYDNNATKPGWKSLCTKLKDGRCISKKSFSYGAHVVDVRVIDKAGNAVSERIEIEIV